ncbi:TetR/AcrR family transcriptional regulator [Nocardia sp. NPDC020380]|uniref:TetR/AcrR family transcriptional regulator n=1 Tax=Nocardia sp. NPDC020380 TaxID=3364309 RepID=UPI0037892597
MSERSAAVERRGAGRGRARRPRTRRAEILEAAIDAFAHDGYHGTSMADIAVAVGVSPPALYRHFRNKQELLGQCLRVGLGECAQRVEEAGRDDPAGAKVLAEVVRVGLEVRVLPRLWQLEFRHVSPADRSAVLRLAVRMVGYLRAAISARRPNLTTADVELLSWCVLSIAVSPSYHRAELPAPVTARVLDAAVTAVVDVPLPATADTPATRTTKAGNGGTELDRALRTERILAEAARLFSLHGYAAVGIEDIGAAVGITGPALYHHFSCKAEVLDHIVRRHDEWMGLLMARALAEGQGAAGAMRSMLHGFAQLAVDDPDLLGITMSETRHLPEDAVRRYRQVRLDGIERWARMLHAVRPELPIPVARVLIRAVTTVIIESVRNPRLYIRADLVDVLTAIGEAIEAAPVPLRKPGPLTATEARK